MERRGEQELSCQTMFLQIPQLYDYLRCVYMNHSIRPLIFKSQSFFIYIRDCVMWIRRIADPVSYTHLDVYKRQLHIWGSNEPKVVADHDNLSLPLNKQGNVHTLGCLLYTSRCV